MESPIALHYPHCLRKARERPREGGRTKVVLRSSLPTAAEGVIKLDRADHFGIVDLL